MVERALRADERQARLVLAGEDADVQAAGLAQHRDQRLTIARPPNRRSGHRRDLFGTHRPSLLELRGDDLGDLVDLRASDLASGPQVRPDPGEGTFLMDLQQLPRTGLGDEEPRRVRADVNAGAAHGAVHATG